MSYTPILAGDNLSWVARYYGTTVKDIVSIRENRKHINRKKMWIYAGDTLWIPCGICPTMHRQNAATVRTIAVRHASRLTAAHGATMGTSVPAAAATQAPVESAASSVDQQLPPSQETETPAATAPASASEPSFPEPPAPKPDFAPAAPTTANPPVEQVESNKETSVQSLKKGWILVPIGSANLPIGMYHAAKFVDDPTDNGEWKTDKDIKRFYIGQSPDGTESVLIPIPKRVTQTSDIAFVIEDAEGQPHEFNLPGKKLLTKAKNVSAPNLKVTHYTNDRNYSEDKKLLNDYFAKAHHHFGRSLYTSIALIAPHAMIALNPYMAIPLGVRDFMYVRGAVKRHHAATRAQQALLISQPGGQS